MKPNGQYFAITFFLLLFFTVLSVIIVRPYKKKVATVQYNKIVQFQKDTISIKYSKAIDSLSGVTLRNKKTYDSLIKEMEKYKVQRYTFDPSIDTSSLTFKSILNEVLKSCR